MTSSTITWGRNRSTAASASPPVPAVSTSKPWNRRAIATTSTMFGSSSTTRIRPFAMAHILHANLGAS
jgi:hypothetical protein